MPNATAGLFETLTAAGSIATQNLTFQNAFLDSIYTEHRPVNGTVGQTLNITIPTVNEANVVDIGAGAIQVKDTSHTAVPIVLNTNYNTAFVVKNWDEVRTPRDLSTMYVQPFMEGLLRAVNRIIANLLTTANFNAYTIVSGAGADVFDRADITAAWTNLARQGVPVDDTSNLFFLTTPTAYGNMLAATNWINEQIVGKTAAEIAQQRAQLVTAYGAQLRWDQHVTNINAGRELGLLMHRYAIGMVTAIPPGAPQGVLETGAVRTFAYPRPNLPIVMEMGYSQVQKGMVIDMSAMFGVAVVRPDHGCLVQTN